MILARSVLVLVKLLSLFLLVTLVVVVEQKNIDEGIGIGGKFSLPWPNPKIIIATDLELSRPHLNLQVHSLGLPRHALLEAFALRGDVVVVFRAELVEVMLNSPHLEDFG